MRKLYIVGLVAVAALVIGIAIADEIKFSTYYPAPFGQYREFSTTGKTTLATDEWGIEGTNARVGIGTTDPTRQLEITKSFELPETTASDEGVIYKGENRFIHDYSANGSHGENTFVGINAGNFTMAPSGGTWEASYNTVVGNQAFHSNTIGSYNSAVGNKALRYNTTGLYNCAIGNLALYSNTTGKDNSAVGNRALYSNTTGRNNSAIGDRALNLNIAGRDNCAVGNLALQVNEGQRNSAMGCQAGSTITTGNYNTFLGYRAGYGDLQKVDASNSMALGNGTYTTANNQVVIGNTDITETLLNGKVGIGTMDPTHGLTIDGNNIAGQGSIRTVYGPIGLSGNNTGININPGITSSAIVFHASDNSSRYTITGDLENISINDLLRFDSSLVNDILVLKGNGNVGIGTDDPDYKLEVNGSAGKPGGGSWSDSSDIRLKKNVKTIEGALEKILKLRGITYQWKEPDKHADMKGTYMSMIAQETEKVFPEWVGTDDGGYKTLGFIGFEALTVEAIRELKAEIGQLKAEIAALKEK